MAIALPPGDRADFESQLAQAELAVLDSEHDTFRFAWPYPDGLRISVDIIDANYADADGTDVNVLVHFVGGLLSWAERFRFDMEVIALWPPPPGAPLRFPPSGMAEKGN